MRTLLHTGIVIKGLGMLSGMGNGPASRTHQGVDGVRPSLLLRARRIATSAKGSAVSLTVLHGHNKTNKSDVLRQCCPIDYWNDQSLSRSHSNAAVSS
jgi:hypothetical protein